MTLSQDLDSRWRGALFALDPGNPDASRHLCTSAREIFTEILEKRAPDGAVLQTLPDCTKTHEGRPTRRARIQFALHQRGRLTAPLEQFVDDDVENIIELFRDHCASGSGSVLCSTDQSSMRLQLAGQYLRLVVEPSGWIDRRSVCRLRLGMSRG